MITLVVFVVGVVCGIALVNALRDTTRILERQEHQKIVMEQGQEIVRLRAQVALHIGKQ